MNKLYFILALGISSVVSTVLAAQATPAPVAALSTNQQAVKKIFDELEKVANSSASGNSAESQLITIYKSHTDHNTLWDQVFPKAAADPSKYLEVKTAFESFNARLFSKNLGSFKGASIKIGREISTEGGGSVSVQTEIKKPSSSTKVTWVLLNGKITNLVVDGISLVVTFRDQLNDLDRQYPDPKQLALHINNAGK